MRWLIAALVVLMASAAWADEVTWTNDGGNGWDDGDEVGQADMDEIKSSVDDNDDRLDALMSTDTCTTPPCDLTSGTTLGGATIVVPGGSVGAATATTPSVNDNDTSVATTAFVQAETVAAGDVTGTIGGGLTIGANTVALSTDTTGNYVATIADSGASEVTVSGSGSEGAAVTLAIASSLTRDSELSAYTITTTDPTDGSDACTTGDQWLNTSGQTIFFCVDGSTDDWWGVNLSDAP